MLPQQALAEAYFRRGQERLYAASPDTAGGLSDLQRAVELLPEDACYTYHLGLAAHRAGDLATAIASYEKVRRGGDEFAQRVAYPLALALLQQGIDPVTSPVWKNLTDLERSMLHNAIAFRRRPYTLEADAPLLWQGLAALDCGETETAQRILQQALNPLPEANVAHYYLGVLAARAGQWDEARKQWTTAYAQGYRSAYLSQNLGELYHRLAEQWLAAGDVESALAAANESARHTPADSSLNEMLSQINQQLGYQAASTGQWEKARHYWEAAYDLEGGSFRLAYNLALVYEKAEDFIAAGEMWREALRRRPRKAGHPDAITDEQVSLLWKRAAEAYVHGEAYEEAINVYKQAVKWNPESLETRMALVEGLLNGGRLRAAENELLHILEKNPHHIPALLRMGEVLVESDNWLGAMQAPNYWEKVLALDPDNSEAQQLLSDYYLDQGENALLWSRYDGAIDNFNQALHYRPDDGYVLARLGACYLWLEKRETAQSYFDQALLHGAQDLRVYEQIIHAWIDAHEPDRAWEMMHQAETHIQGIPYQFYVAQGIYALEVDRDMSQRWLDHALEIAPSHEEPLAMIGQLLALSPFVDLAQEYLERAVAAGQDLVRSWTSLVILALRRGDSQSARRYLRYAEREARRSQNPDMLRQVEITGKLLDVPPALLDIMIRNIAMPLLNGELPEGLPFPDEYNDEEWEDDNEFYNLFRY